MSQDRTRKYHPVRKKKNHTWYVLTDKQILAQNLGIPKKKFTGHMKPKKEFSGFPTSVAEASHSTIPETNVDIPMEMIEDILCL